MSWFKKSASFACIACGKCCRSGNTRVFVNASEVEALAKHVQVSTSEEFLAKYTQVTHDQNGRELVTLKSDYLNKQCIFLREKQCSVYEVRPTQCRTYPFWPQNMVGHAEWRAEARNCPGINLSITDQANIVDESTVVKNIIIHAMHARGTGPDWTYEVASDLLDDVIEAEPATIDEYLSSFFEIRESRIVFESPLLRVVDFKTAVPVNNSNQNNADNPADGDAEATENGADAPPIVVYTRRMEFVNSPRLTQTEVFLTGRPSDWPSAVYGTTLAPENSLDGAVQGVVNHTRLHMAVHSTMAMLVNRFLAQRHRNTSISIAVIGAGCCALPSFLLHNIAGDVAIHAVEPSAEVLAAAERYFGAAFSGPIGSEQSSAVRPPDQIGSCLLPYTLTGEDFLRLHPDLRCDVIVLDAFADAVDSGSSDGAEDEVDAEVMAPPLTLLDCLPELYRALGSNCSGGTDQGSGESGTGSGTRGTGTGGGLLLINVYGTEAWKNSVVNRVMESGLFAAPVVLETSLGADAGGSPTVSDAPGVDRRNVVLAVVRKEDKARLNQL